MGCPANLKEEGEWKKKKKKEIVVRQNTDYSMTHDYQQV